MFTIAITITLSEEQEAASGLIFEYLGASRMRPFVLQGLAGTGKTTVLAEIARDVPQAILCTLTGKAASVLRRKTGLMASTVHSAFYKLTDKTNDRLGREKLYFEPVHGRGELADKIVLIDECSMINHALAADIMRTGAKIVACGDQGQLAPVEGQRYFNEADIVLETIHRQAMESPIIRQAHAVRHDRMYRDDGDFRFIKRAVTDEEILGADVILCYTNDTRRVANAHARAVRGYWQSWPQEGEPVMCLKNAPAFGVFNGAVYTLEQPFVEGDTSIQIDVDGVSTVIPFVYFIGLKNCVPQHVEATTGFDFGYAMTVHKAQGSEWPNVVLIDEYHRATERREWLYTAITRASERITVTQYPIGYKPPPPLPF
jgi:exodeoxyribonuclease-5